MRTADTDPHADCWASWMDALAVRSADQRNTNAAVHAARCAGGAARALLRARSLTNSAAWELQHPPTSMPSTTSRQRRPETSAGYVRALARSATRKAAPAVRPLSRRSMPAAVKGRHQTASCTPPHKGRPFAMTSIASLLADRDSIEITHPAYSGRRPLKCATTTACRRVSATERGCLEHKTRRMSAQDAQYAALRPDSAERKPKPAKLERYESFAADCLTANCKPRPLDQLGASSQKAGVRVHASTWSPDGSNSRRQRWPSWPQLPGPKGRCKQFVGAAW